MTTNSKKKDNKEEKINYPLIVLGLIGFGLILIVVVYTLTREAHSTTFDYTNTGQIGDTIGGITAPFIGLLGAGLVFISFLKQVEANKIQKRAIDEEIERSRNERNFNTYLGIVKDLKDDFENLNYSEYDGAIVQNGLDALLTFTSFIQMASNSQISEIQTKLDDPFCNNYQYVLHIFNNVFEKVRISNLDRTDKELIYEMLAYFYLNKLSKSNKIILAYENAVINYINRWIKPEHFERETLPKIILGKFKEFIRPINITELNIRYIRRYYHGIVSAEK